MILFTLNVVQTAKKMNTLSRFKVDIVNGNNTYDNVTRTGRDVVDAVFKLMSWVGRVGVPVHTSGRPSVVETAKGALIIICDPQRMWDAKVR